MTIGDRLAFVLIDVAAWFDNPGARQQYRPHYIWTPIRPEDHEPWDAPVVERGLVRRMGWCFERKDGWRPGRYV